MAGTWRAEWNLNQPELDSDHRRQFDLVRRFINLPTDEIWRADAAKLLRELRALSVDHFAREEKVAQAVRFPGLEGHRDQHRRLVTMLDEMIAQVDNENALFPFSYVKDRADPLLQFWFLDHFAKSDMAVKPYIDRVLAKM